MNIGDVLAVRVIEHINIVNNEKKSLAVILSLFLVL